MPGFENRAESLYATHYLLATEMTGHQQYIDAIRSDVALRRAMHDAHEDPNDEMYGKVYHDITPPTHVEVYTETQRALDQIPAYQALHDKAEKRYDRNIRKAKTHVARHLPKYIALARVEMEADLAAERAVSQGAEDFLRDQA